MSADLILYAFAPILALLTGFAYIASFVHMTMCRGFAPYFLASLGRIALGVIFVLVLLRLPTLMGILMVIVCFGAAVVALRYIRPTSGQS
ncbi:MAG: hypothetical protein M1549_02800 [Candidatus Dependentiae bacterium]|nr:hypothetical protein [Candidatus Dependentiae bacterium]